MLRRLAHRFGRPREEEGPGAASAIETSEPRTSPAASTAELNPTEEALLRYIAEAGESGLATTQAELADALGKSRKQVARSLNRLRDELGLIEDDRRQGKADFVVRLRTDLSDMAEPLTPPREKSEANDDEDEPLGEEDWDAYFRESPAAATAELIQLALDGFTAALEERLELVFQAVDRLETAALDLLLELDPDERKAVLHHSPALSEMTRLAGERGLDAPRRRENGRRSQPAAPLARRDVDALAREARRAAAEEREQAVEPEVDPVAELLAEIDNAGKPVDVFGAAPVPPRE